MVREVNFSVPQSNRASVGITTALYDRRALDCTSTLPLINSLNHLAYLTTSSARIREILTVDGGIERLICLLKQGRNKDMLDTWKWNLAFQCIVNIGVRGSDGKATDNRGSENIRTRVVEADIVPVLATILDNYIQIVEKLRARSEDAEVSRGCSRFGSSRRQAARPDDRTPSGSNLRNERRREAPPPITIPPTPQPQAEQPRFSAQLVVPSSPPHDQPATLRPIPHHHHHHHHHLPTLNHPQRLHPARHGRHDSTEASSPVAGPEARIDQRLRASTWAAPASPSALLPPMTAGLRDVSQPNTPTTPRALSRADDDDERMRDVSPSNTATPRRPHIHRQISMSGSDDENTDALLENNMPGQDQANGGLLGPPGNMDMEQLRDHASILETTPQNDTFVPSVAGDAELDAFNLHREQMDASIIEQMGGQTNPGMNLSPAPQFQGDETPMQGTTGGLGRQSPALRDASSSLYASMPRDEDVVLSLQLLAYVSKYCQLRSYFQQSHLVPRLKIANELKLMEGTEESIRQVEEDDDNEYCQEQDYNIFPLVEKFTVNQKHQHEMRYWACVVMRNLCRKDKARGDIRQCAYYKCGKWEEYARQFAKCRRCRQTKYCSKDCQKNAWTYHRHWCQLPSSPHAVA